MKTKMFWKLYRATQRKSGIIIIIILKVLQILEQIKITKDQSKIET